MNTSFSKKRYLVEANEQLEKKFLQSKKMISEEPEVIPKYNPSEMISLSQDILKQNGANFNIQDYVSSGDNPMCVPNNDKTGILSKIFDYLNGLGTTNEIENSIKNIIVGQDVGGIKIPNELRNDAAIIGAGLIAADESEGVTNVMSEQGINYKKRARQQNSKRNVRKHTKCYRKHNKF
jgi:hypothetical protein